jgi:hypothetical protein
MIRFLSAALLALSASAASADMDFGSYDQFQTRFGAASVAGARPSQGLVVSGATLPVEQDYMWEILGAWALEGADHDWLLATHHHGGNMCGPGVTVIRVGQGTVQVMGETEACEGAVSDMRIEPDALELDIFVDGMRQQFTTYRFSDAGMETTPGEQPFAGTPAGPGADATRWIGEHPFAIFRDPGERARFLTIMSEHQIRDLSDRIGPANSVIQRGDWVLGAGCMAHACNISAGAWGIRISDGAAAAAIYENGTAPQVYGPAAYDPVFAGWMAENNL